MNYTAFSFNLYSARMYTVNSFYSLELTLSVSIVVDFPLYYGLMFLIYEN
jgi:hypothetical protein